MKLTKQGIAAKERAWLNDEGKESSFEHSPYKHAAALDRIEDEISRLQSISKINYTPRMLTRQRNALIMYFNKRGAEYTMCTKQIKNYGAKNS